jgi:uncharacterized protein CbrC (UPF0167 family)
MSTTRTEPEDSVLCWCCGQERPAASAVHLGSHPEVQICPQCAHYLWRRAVQRRDQLHPSAMSRVRGGMWSVRDLVVRKGWHRKPVVGDALRWIGRHLP